MGELPDYVTHYYRADRSPFQNLSDLDDRGLAAVLAGLNAPGSQDRSARRFGPQYMALRRATEERARQLFIDAGGSPVRTAPHYLVLGSSKWFAGLYRTPAEIRFPLRDLPHEVTSATWFDSISALGLGVRLGLPAPNPQHADRVYRLNELAARARDHGLPTDTAPALVTDYADHERGLVDTYIEIQLWADDPIAHYLTAQLDPPRR